MGEREKFLIVRVAAAGKNGGECVALVLTFDHNTLDLCPVIPSACVVQAEFGIGEHGVQFLEAGFVGDDLDAPGLVRRFEQRDARIIEHQPVDPDIRVQYQLHREFQNFS
jgi:hypothetical protein